MNKLILLYMLVMLLHSTLAHSYLAPNLPPSSPVPGGIALVIIPPDATNNSRQPKVFFQGTQVMVLPIKTQQHTKWAAIVGIPLKTKPSMQFITVNFANNKKQNINFEILDKTYQKQYITIKNKRQVNPNKLDMPRIIREKKEIITAFRHWNDSTRPTTKLLWPLSGKVSSTFGLQRFYNNEPRNPHSGIDIAASTGTPIKAPAKATVIAIGNYFFNGLTIMLDHGHGLITMYCHLSQTNVGLGEQVSTGQLIGLVGTTGRSTGPHLHWSVSLNDSRINPYLLIKDE